MCPVQDARPEEPGSRSGSESPPSVSRGLLLVKVPRALPIRDWDVINERVSATAALVGLTPMVVTGDIEVSTHPSLEPLISQMAAMTEQIGKLAMMTAACVDALAAQEEPPDMTPDDLGIPRSLSTRR